MRAGRQGAAPPLARARTTPRRSACSTARSSSIRTTRMPMPGRPACWARPGSTAGATIATPPCSRWLTELQIALALDDNDSDVHRILAAVNLTRDNHDKAAYHQERALSAQSQLRPHRRAAGRVPDLARPAGGGDRLDQEGDAPQPVSPGALLEPPRPRLLLRREYAEAAEAFARITRPDYTHHAFLAATFAQMGNAVGGRGACRRGP